MIRLAGKNIHEKRQVWIGLTEIYGVGKQTALKICQEVGIDLLRKIGELTENEISSVRAELEKYTIEGDLRNEKLMSIKRLIEIGCYRGKRHSLGLPVRGQRTRTNARTRKGPRGAAIAAKRKE